MAEVDLWEEGETVYVKFAAGSMFELGASLLKFLGVVSAEFAELETANAIADIVWKERNE